MVTHTLDTLILGCSEANHIEIKIIALTESVINTERSEVYANSVQKSILPLLKQCGSVLEKQAG
jgi:hypothetical protein